MNAPLHRELPPTVLDSATALAQVTRKWDDDIVRQLTDYIAIPAKSPGFDGDWEPVRARRRRDHFIDLFIRSCRVGDGSRQQHRHEWARDPYGHFY